MNSTTLRPLADMTKEEIASLSAADRQAYEDAYDYSAVNYSDMVRQLAKKGDVLLAELSGADCHVLHMSACLPGECGEIEEIVLKFRVLGEELDTDALQKDYSDLLFYYEGTLQAYDIAHDEVMAAECHEKMHPLLTVLREQDRAVGTGRAALDLPARISLTTSCLTAACGEVWDTCKRDVIYRKPVDRTRLIRGLRSVYTLLALAADDQGWDMGDIELTNKRKLAGPFGRYKLSEGYQDKSAQDRADENVAKG